MLLHTGHSENDTDFISALTGLFKDIATAVEQNHDLLLGSFGVDFLIEFTLGLQAECDVQVSGSGHNSLLPMVFLAWLCYNLLGVAFHTLSFGRKH